MNYLFDIHRKQMEIMEQDRKYKVQCENYRIYNEALMVPIEMMEAQIKSMCDALIWGINCAAIRRKR